MIEIKGITAQVNDCPCRGEVFAPMPSHLLEAAHEKSSEHQQEHGPSACTTICTG